MLQFGKSLGVLALAIVSAGAFAQFTPGNLAIVRVGNGTTALGTAAADVSVLEFNPVTGTFTSNAINVTRSASLLGGITLAGSGSSEGSINTWTKFGYFAGYDAVSGTASVATNATTRRIVAVDYLSGSLSVTQDLVGPTGAIRSAITADGSNFFVSGNSGVQSGTFGSSAVAATGSTGQTKQLVNANGTLYYAQNIAGFNGIREVGTNTAITNFSTIPSDFALSPDGLTLYVASESASGGGILRFSRANTSALFTGSGTTLYNVASRNMAFQVDGSGRHNLYITTNTGSLVGLLDAATASTITPAFELAPSANFAYRGLDIVAVPEPGTLAIFGLGLIAAARRRRK